MPRVALEQVCEPDAELDVDGLVETHPLPDALNVFLGGLVSGEDDGRISGDDVDEREGDDGDDPQDGEDSQYALNYDIPSLDRT